MFTLKIGAAYDTLVVTDPTTKQVVEINRAELRKGKHFTALDDVRRGVVELFTEHFGGKRKQRRGYTKPSREHLAYSGPKDYTSSASTAV